MLSRPSNATFVVELDPVPSNAEDNGSPSESVGVGQCPPKFAKVRQSSIKSAVCANFSGGLGWTLPESA